MKVNERKGVLDPRLGGTGGVTLGADASPAPGPGARDQVSVSEAARGLARLRAEVGDVEAIRADRVAELRRATGGGGWVADTQGAARGLVREVLDELLA